MFSHLENNAFKRFKESSDYQRILDMVSEQETIQDVLRRSRMIQGLDSHSAIGLHRSSWTDVEDDDLPLLTNSDLSISLRGGSPVRSYL